MSLDIKNFYLNTPMERYEYVRLKLDDVPTEIQIQYGLRDKVDQDGYVHIEVRKGMYGLPQAGILAQQLLEQRLNKHGHFQNKAVPGLWTHETRPISFTLVVDDFGIKYVGQEHALHLINILKEHYELSEDWKGTKFIGLTLEWDYPSRKVHISMPGYSIMKLLQKYKHKMPKHPQHCPFALPPKQYGSAAQATSPLDDSPPLSADDIKHLQQIISSILYYASAVDMTVLMALSTIASKQAKGTTQSLSQAHQLLD